MRGDKIPLTTCYRITDKGTEKFKRPLYKLRPASEIKAKQDALGKNAGWYYGTWCDKCCGVYPAFYSEGDFRDYCYYVCLVCGKESEHEPMPWAARDDWNAGRFIYDPNTDTAAEFEQLTIFDFIKEG